VSRIQDILAKAERDGTTRRTQTDAAPMPLAAGVVAPIDGTGALDPAVFMPATVTTMGSPAAAATMVDARTAPRIETVTSRTARATLHPALVAAIAPHSAVAEQYRAIRSRITAREDGQPMRSVVVTSPGTRDGKSITAANLALTMAQEYQRTTVLIDGDLRKPSIHALLGLEQGPGLADVLAGEISLDDALVYLPDHRLTVLTAGTVPQFPTELLGSGAMRRTLDTLRARFDRLLLDLPAVTPLADVGTVAPLADGVVMVVRAGVTQRPALEEALAVFEADKVLGVVLNDAR